MNTKNKQDQKNQRDKGREQQAPKKQGRNPNALHGGPKHHDHEYPEMRMTR
jgi:hypothetical protein